MPLYHIYLPLTYNDGRPVEEAKLDLTRRELVDRFGGCTFTPPGYPLQGWWHSGEAVVRDDISICTILTNQNENGFFNHYKEVLRRRFNQQEILIIKIPAEAL